MTASPGQRPLRLMYAAGPGNVIGTYRHWRDGRDDPGQVAMTYSGQFYDVCRELGAEGYVIAYHPLRDFVRDGPFRVEHRPIPFIKSRAPLYHLGQIWSALRMILTALRFRANALVICDGTCHWFPLRLLPKLGVKVIPTIHCMLWRKNVQPGQGRVARIRRKLDVPFFRRSARAILSASGDITRQVERYTDRDHAPVIEFLPTYRPGTFAEHSEPPAARTPFRVLFAGRIERFKGVFDLLEITRQLLASGRTDIEMDLCGAGSALEELRKSAQDAGVTERFLLHGHCTRAVMREMFQKCHVLIVPTTTDFAEGFNQVVVEGILAGRPVITSSVCPALEYVRDAVLEVPPNDVPAYREAIERLAADPGLYDRMRGATLRLQEQFYDASMGWAGAVRSAVTSEVPEPVTITSPAGSTDQATTPLR